MRVFAKLFPLIVIVAANLISTAASAHGIWFAERSSQLALIYGVGADDLDTVKRLHKVETINAYDNDWGEIDASLRTSGPLLLVNTDQSLFAVSAVMQNGSWSRMPNGKWEEGGRDENSDAVLAEKTIKYAVHIPGVLPKKIPLLPTQTVQIIPVGDAMPNMLGEEMTVKVLYRGQPAEGAKVTADFVTDPDAIPVVTGKDGLATIKIRNQGLNVVVAIFDGPSDAPKVIDKIEHLATLSFVLEHEPE